MTINEKELLKKVIREETDNSSYLTRMFPYSTEKILLENMHGLYPAMNMFLWCNMDNIDKNGIPLMKTKQFRPITTAITTDVYGTKTISTPIQMVFGIINNDQVYLKSMRAGTKW